MAVERERSHELVESMVGAASSHVLGSLLQARKVKTVKGKEKLRGKHSLNAYSFPINHYELRRKGQDDADHWIEEDSNIARTRATSTARSDPGQRHDTPLIRTGNEHDKKTDCTRKSNKGTSGE